MFIDFCGMAVRQQDLDSPDGSMRNRGEAATEDCWGYDTKGQLLSTPITTNTDVSDEGCGRSLWLVPRVCQREFVMLKSVRYASVLPLLAFATGCSTGQSSSSEPRTMSTPPTTMAEPVHEEAALKKDSLAALQTLYAKEPKAKEIANKSKAVLVFPNLVKAGFLGGVQWGDGVLIENGKITGIYNNTALSYGLQAGVQTFAQAMFLTTDAAVKYLRSSDGWSIGMGPSIVLVDEGAARSLTTTTLQSDVYAFIFGQKGLMAGLGIQGQKITRLGN
jgi:lipid-binding SYLF domain-containing protein